jgi:hypothetical protein
MRSFGTIFVERSVDILIVFVFFSSSGLILFRDRMPDLVLNLLFCSFGAIAVLIISFLIIKRKRFITKLIPQRFLGFYQRFEEGAINSINRLPAVLSLTIVIWLLEILRLYFVLIALKVSMSFSSTVLISLSAALLTTLPITPAGIGAVELAMIGLFALFDIDSNVAASVTILDRVISYWSIMLGGYFLYFDSVNLTV